VIKSFEHSLKVMMLAYPDLFPTPDYALNHLFLVIGNGYDWWNGVLMERPPDDLCREVEKMLVAGRPEEEIRAMVEKDKETRHPIPSMMKNTIAKLKAAGMDTTGLEGPLVLRDPLRAYPMCEYSKLMKVPENVQDDWLEAAFRALTIAETVPSYDEEEPVKNKKWAKEAREDIERIKASRSTGAGGTSRLAI